MDSKPRKMTTEDYRVLNSCAEMVRCPTDLQRLPVKLQNQPPKLTQCL